jgi:hypothetical protein
LSSPEITSLSQSRSSQPVSRPRLDRTIIHRLTPTPNTARRLSTVPSVHKGTNCKKSGWRLPNISKCVVILGDSNVSKITESTERDIQLESYPGAKIRNLEQMMIHPAETDGTHPEIVILSVGINDRANKPGVTTIPNLRRMAVRAGKCFPNSVIAIPEINCSDRSHYEYFEKPTRHQGHCGNT